MHHSLHASLNDAELDDLGRYLESIPGAMHIEMLDGFFAALACSPEVVMPSVFFPRIWGEDHEFTTLEEAKSYSKLVIRHWNSIAGRLKSDGAYNPVRRDGEDDCLIGNEWAEGFMRGVQIGGEAWQELFNDADNGGLLVSLLSLARQYGLAPEPRPESIDADKRKMAVDTISSFVPAAYRYFSRYRSKYPVV